MTTTKKKNTKRVAIVGGTVAALMGGGIAFAAWTSTGTGDGKVTAGSDSGLLVTAAQDVTGLFPTGSQDVSVTVQNKNPYKFKVESVKVGAAGITSDKPGCVVEDIVTTPNKTGLSDVLEKYGTSGAADAKTYTFTVSMTNDAADACKGAVFTIPFVASGESSD